MHRRSDQGGPCRPPDELRCGKPIIGIAQTGSDLSPCNRHHIELTSRVRDGIRDAGGVPLEFPIHPIQETGKRIVDMVKENLRPSDIMTRQAFENAVVAAAALGASSNCPIPMVAIVRHMGVEIPPRRRCAGGHEGFAEVRQIARRRDDPSPGKSSLQIWKPCRTATAK